jgi:hypothetical protein
MSRALAAATGTAAAALVADELPPGRRRFRRQLPKRSAHHVLAELGPEDAERTIVLVAHHDAAHTAFFFNPAITEAVGERAPWVFEETDTSPPLIWPVAGGPALVAAGAALDNGAFTRLGTLLSAGSLAFMAHIGAGEVVPGANDNGSGCVALLALAAAIAEQPTEDARILFLSTGAPSHLRSTLEQTPRPSGRGARNHGFRLTLGSLDVGGLGTLVPGLDVVGHLGALGEGAMTIGDDRAEVHEGVISTVIGGDEPEALVVAEPLHCACRHLCPPLFGAANAEDAVSNDCERLH